MSDPKTELLKQAADFKEKIGKVSHYEIFGIPPTSSASEVKKAYFKFVKSFHPDSLVGLNLNPDELNLIKGVFGKLTEIQDTLINADRRKDYDELLKSGVTDEAEIIERANRVLKSELEFQKGEILVKRGKFAEAEGYLRNAVKLNMDEADFWAVLAWATYNKREGSKEENRAKARKYLEKAFKIKEASHRTHYYQGLVYKIDGNKELALIHLKRAYELDPTSEVTKVEIIRLGGKLPQVKPGTKAGAA